MSSNDERFMRRALELSRRAPFTSPNPRVGAVVVRGGEVIGEGWHEGAGTPHAEVRALEGIDARGAVMYVTLEPCAHHGRTPPCAPHVVEAGIATVVAAVADPDRRVSGEGFDYLRSHGVQVIEGVLADDATRLNAAYFYHRSTGRPRLTLKLALSLDGRLAAPDGSARWISGEAARKRVHQHRMAADAILIGAGSVLADDPELTVRAIPSVRQPARVVVDARGRVSPDAKVFAHGAEVIVATTEAAPHDVQTAWKEAGAEVLVLPAAGEGVDLGALMKSLGGRGFVEVYCEGGAELATSLLADDIVEQLEFHYGPIVLGRGGPELGDVGVGSMVEALSFETVAVEELDGDVLVTLVKELRPAPKAPALPHSAEPWCR
ncbi:MAG: bifunctional diaminohydroxyphosphoribosylaminopyrimidine deaminase/5-amino-6-(5-phosphoribosylamino)uracil reductase RibD [Actinomycetota bacterium]